MHSLSSWRMVPPGGAPLPVASILRGMLPDGWAVSDLRTAFRQRFGRRFAFLAGSGRSALAMALAAIRRENPGRDQVLLPAYVSYSVPSAVAAAGCRITLYDVDPGSLAPDFRSMEKAVTARTLAVLACPLFGYPFDTAPAKAICRDNGIPLVDDAAQVMGGTVNGRDAGCLGDVGIFSLSRGKPITAVDGGILLTDDERIARAVEIAVPRCGAASGAILPAKAMALAMLRRPVFYRLPASLPWLMLGESVFDPSFPDRPFSAFQAKLAAQALSSLDATNAARARVASFYADILSGTRVAGTVSQEPGAQPIYLRFPVLPGPGASHWQDMLTGKQGKAAKRLGISRGFPLSVDRIPEARPFLDAPVREYPGARYLAGHLVTLPTHDQTTERDCRAALDFILSAAGGKPAATCRDAGKERP